MLLSLRFKIAASLAMLLLLFASLMVYLADRQTTAFAEETLQKQTRGQLEVLAQVGRESVEFDDRTGLEALLQGASMNSDLLSLEIVSTNADEEVLAVWRRKGFDPERPGLDAIDLETSIGEPGRPLAVLRGVVSKKALKLQLGDQREVAIWVTSLLVLLASVGGFFMARLFTQPIVGLSALASHALKTGDISGEVKVNSSDESGELSRTINALIAALRDAVRAQQTAGAQLDNALQRSLHSADAVRESGAVIRDRVADTRAALGRVTDRARSATAVSAELERVEETTSSQVNYVARRSGEIASLAIQMSRSMANTLEQVDSIAATLSLTSRNMAKLDQSVAEATDSMEEINTAINQVRESAQATVDLSNQTTQAASDGALAMRDTVSTIASVEDVTRRFSDTMGVLDGKLDAIDSLVDVIKEVADRTTLLALNASIIAAQAGSEGRGFAVVAEQIKQLSSRSRDSTERIGGVIREIQDSSGRALELIANGVRVVEQSVVKTRNVENVFKRIETAAVKSEAMVQRIAIATSEQSGATQRLTQTVGSIAENTRAIAEATRGQTRRAELIRNETQNVNQLTESVRAATKEQSERADEIVRLIEQVANEVQRVGDAQRDQLTAASAVVDLAEVIDVECSKQLEAMATLDETSGSLKSDWKVLFDTLSRFRT